MPIPPYSIDGIIPPYIGVQGPGDNSNLMSPYKVTVAEVISYFATTVERTSILKGWLTYREELRRIGIVEGFQWLDGSFVEDKERIRGVPPNDLDMVTFFRRPHNYKSDSDFRSFITPNKHLLDRNYIKTNYHLDAFPIDLDGNAEATVTQTRYWLQLFSHQRGTDLWKGMLHVQQDDGRDDAALLARLASTTQGGGP